MAAAAAVVEQGADTHKVAGSAALSSETSATGGEVGMASGVTAAPAGGAAAGAPAAPPSQSEQLPLLNQRRAYAVRQGAGLGPIRSVLALYLVAC